MSVAENGEGVYPMTRTYDETGIRLTGTGAERRLPDGRTIQMSDQRREKVEIARLLAAIDVAGEGA